MAHIKSSSERASATPTEWLPLGRQVGELANLWSGRYDLVGYVGENAGHGAPACYNPALAEIEVDVVRAFGKGVTPEMIGDLHQRKAQYEFPRAVGALYHEAFHATFSEWSMEKAHESLKEDEYGALVLLEETRIEYQGLLAKPRSLPFLRASAMDLVVADSTETFSTMPDTAKSAFLVALVHARAEAGILDPEDVAEITDLVDEFLGYETVSQLLEIAEKFRAHDDHANADPVLYDLAREWAKIVRDKTEENRENQEPGSEGEGESALSEFAEALVEAMEEAKATVAISGSQSLDEQEQKEDWQEQVEEKASKSKDDQMNRDTAKKIFSKSSGGEGRTSSRLIETRKPTTEERRGAVTIASWLEKAKYRERDLTEIASVVPPGRLRTRALVQGKAMEARGVYQQVAPFRKKVRKQTEEPTLTVGVMVDISGSMNSAMEPMASTAWIMSEAVRRVQGKTAMVYYGNEVFPTLKPGQHLGEVKVWSASDGTERFDEAFRALDGALNLLNGSGARLLVVTSDGAYTSEEVKKSRKWVKRCREAGVAVLWLPFDGGYHSSPLENLGATVVRGELDPATSALEIGKQASRALTEVGRRNA
jgi:hypothetical protein